MIHLPKNDFTTESRRAQRKTFFRIPERGILKKLTSIEKSIYIFAHRAFWIVFPPGPGKRQ
jgi:hypothetical protein